MLRDALVVDAALEDEVVLEVSTYPVNLHGASLIKLRVYFHNFRELILAVADPFVLDVRLLL